MSYGVQFVLSFLTQKLGKRVGKQILVITLLVFGVEKKRIKALLSISDVTLSKYSKAQKNEDFQSIFKQNYNQPQSELEKHRETIELELENNPQPTRRGAAVIIEEMTGIKRSLPRIGKFLKKGASKAVQ
jgi:ABC-type phosphate transport system auxiliary subunit